MPYPRARYQGRQNQTQTGSLSSPQTLPRRRARKDSASEFLPSRNFNQKNVPPNSDSDLRVSRREVFHAVKFFSQRKSGHTFETEFVVGVFVRN